MNPITLPTGAGLSLLIPVMNEQDSIPQLWSEIEMLAVQLRSDYNLNLEVLFVDDGSSDGTWYALNELEVGMPGLTLVRERFRANRGKSAALRRAIDIASFDLIAMMDGDLQDRPDQLLGMLGDLESVDLVVGYKQDRQDPLSKRLPSRVFNRITSAVTGLRLHDHNCGLKLGHAEAFRSVPLYGEMHRFLAAIAHWEGFVVAERPVIHRRRVHGRSKFGLERYLRGAIDLLTVVSLTRYHGRPGHLFGGMGVLSTFSGIGVLGYLSFVRLGLGQPIGSRPLLLLGILLLTLGVQLVSLGILAELVQRQAFHSQRQRPTNNSTGRREF